MSHATPVVFVVDDASVRECLGALIIFVGARAEMPAAVQAMNAGAADFLAKPVRDELRLNAIRDALDRSRAALGQESALQALQDRHASLSRREREVMALVVVRPAEQAGRRRARHQRNHREGPPRPSDAEDEGRVPARPGEDVRETRPAVRGRDARRARY